MNRREFIQTVGATSVALTIPTVAVAKSARVPAFIKMEYSWETWARYGEYFKSTWPKRISFIEYEYDKVCVSLKKNPSVFAHPDGLFSAPLAMCYAALKITDIETGKILKDRYA